MKYRYKGIQKYDMVLEKCLFSVFNSILIVQ